MNNYNWFTACLNDDIKLIQQYIHNNFDVNIINPKSGWTGLMIAAYWGKNTIVWELIKAGADVNIRDKYERTAIMFAVSWGHLEIVKELIKAGADLHHRDHFGENLLNKSAILACRPNIIKELLQYNLDINNQDADIGDTILINIACMGTIQDVKMLLDAGARIDIKNFNGTTAITAARMAKNEKVADFLEWECLRPLRRAYIQKALTNVTCVVRWVAEKYLET